MSEVALIPLSSQGQFAEPFQNALSGNSGLVVALAMAALLLLLALGAMIAAARVLLEPVFALIGTLLRLLFVLGAAVAVIVILVSGSAHGAGPDRAGVDRPPAGPPR
jgi:hypothetical protein